MSTKGAILIVDSNANRRKDLCEMWSGVLGFEVVFYDVGEFFKFQSNAGQRGVKLGEDLDTIKVSSCLFHVNDLDDDPALKTVVTSCKTVVLFGGAGILRGDDRL